MSNPFQSISGRRPQSSQFDLSHTRKFSFKPGVLYPILAQEALPSDVWQYDASAVVRMAPMLAPIMHMVDVCAHSFFYPERLTQARGMFEVFITGGTNGDGKDALGNTVVPPYFVIKATGASGPDGFNLNEFFYPGSLADFLGLQYAAPSPGGGNTTINARLFIAFWRIWCEYFRDQNLDPDFANEYPNIFDSVGGNITEDIWEAHVEGFTFFSLPHVRWEKDYFTSAMPFAQRGEAVEAPLTGNAVVNYRDSAIVTQGGAPDGSDTLLSVEGSSSPILTGSPGGAPNTFDGLPRSIDNIESIQLTTGGFTITALRTAARLQEWLEKMATGGSRYIEQIKAQFGVTSSDARLQRAEYLGGGKIPMHISEVIQTSFDNVGQQQPIGQMAGHGVTAGNPTGFKKFCEEHGFFMVFLYLRPKTAYQQGIPRVFTDRFDKLDYAWPSFSRIGEQEILQREIYFTGNNLADNAVFGYQQRYAEYKYIPSTVHGEFRTTLDHWHWGRIFDTDPVLSSSFVRCDPSERIFNVLDDATDSLYCIVNNRITARRPLPYYGEPYL